MSMQLFGRMLQQLHRLEKQLNEFHLLLAHMFGHVTLQEVVSVSYRFYDPALARSLDLKFTNPLRR